MVIKPDGSRWDAPFTGQEVPFTETDLPGFYGVVMVEDGTPREAGIFAVNLFSVAESQIAPAENVTVGAVPIQTGTEDDVGRFEFGLWLAGAALIVLLVEWWIFHQGTRLPTLPTQINLTRLFGRQSKG